MNSNTMIFDTETTGLPTSMYPVPFYTPDYDSCRLFQIAWYIVDEYGLIVSKEMHYVSPPDGTTLSPSHTTPNLLEEAKKYGKPLKEVLKSIEKAASTTSRLMAFNSPFDVNIVLAEIFRLPKEEQNEFYNLRIIFQTFEQVCIMRLLTPVMKLPSKNGIGYKWPSLKSVAIECLGEEEGSKQTHHADDDVEMLWKCIMVLNENDWISLFLKLEP